MPESPKILFADSAPAPSTAAIDLTVIAEEIRKSFTLGFDKAIQFYQTMTQPPPAPTSVAIPGVSGAGDDDELGPGVIDMGSLWQMSPEGREAVLRNYGLQVFAPAAPEPDPTHETMHNTIKADGHEPPTGEGEED